MQGTKMATAEGDYDRISSKGGDRDSSGAGTIRSLALTIFFPTNSTSLYFQFLLKKKIWPKTLDLGNFGQNLKFLTKFSDFDRNGPNFGTNILRGVVQPGQWTEPKLFGEFGRTETNRNCA